MSDNGVEMNEHEYEEKPVEDGTYLGQLSPKFGWLWLGSNSGWERSDKKEKAPARSDNDIYT